MKAFIPFTAGWQAPVRPGPRLMPRKGKRRPRKVPREVRAQVYQLELTLRETDAEIRRILDAYGFSKQARNAQRARIRAERGQ